MERIERCPVEEQRFNAKRVSEMLKEHANKIGGIRGEGCISAENYLIYYRVVTREELNIWIDKHHVNDPMAFAIEIESEMYEKWHPKKEKYVMVNEGWLNSPEWDSRYSEIYHEVYKVGQSVVKIRNFTIEGSARGGTLKVGIGNENPWRRIDPSVSQSYNNHSPDGFGWGYRGSAPAQAALGILLEALPSDYAVTNHMTFMHEITSQIPEKEDFVMVLRVKKEYIDVTVDSKGNKIEKKFTLMEPLL